MVPFKLENTNSLKPLKEKKKQGALPYSHICGFWNTINGKSNGFLVTIINYNNTSIINHQKPIIMTTIIKLVIASVLALLMTSCNMNFGVRGNGNVKTVERTVNGSFDEIEVSRGLDVYLTQGDSETISVQADENLHDIIKTEINGNVLKIYADENISYSEARKIMVSFKTISKISASSGSDVYSTNTFTSESLRLTTSSGSDMKLDIKAQSVDCSASSGSDLKLSGTTINLKAEASSGSDINAGELKAESSRVQASSGADVVVNTSKELYASANSGGDIKYHGNPEKVEKSDGVSGSVNEN